jgi:hypothetical protein
MSSYNHDQPVSSVPVVVGVQLQGGGVATDVIIVNLAFVSI